MNSYLTMMVVSDEMLAVCRPPPTWRLTSSGLQSYITLVFSDLQFKPRA